MKRRDFLLTSALALPAGFLRAQTTSTAQSSQASQGAKARLRVGVIGHTGQGNYGHGEDLVWLAIPRTEIVAVADADPKGREAEAKKLGGVRAFEDYRVMLAECKPDIAAICPRHIHEHHAMILAAVAAGVKGIYMEKPFVRTLLEADEVVRRCAERGVRLAVAHRNRYHPVLPLVKQLVDAGEIGEVREVRVTGKQDHRGGGLDLWVLGCHGFNIATFFTGAATSCEAQVLVEGRPATRGDVHPGDEGVGPIVGDEIHARYETERGIPLYFDSKKGAASKEAPFGTRIVGARGVLAFHADREPLVVLERGGSRVPVTTGGIDKPESLGTIRLINGGHHGAVNDLLAAIEEGREPLCGPAAGRETVELTLGVFASFAAGGAKVSLPLRERSHPLA